MAAFPILKKRVMTPKIPQPQYRLAASIRIKGRQVGCAPRSPEADRTRLLTGRSQCCHSCHRPPAASAAQAVSASWLQKTLVGLEPKQKQYSSKKKLPSPDTWLCQIRSIIVSIRYLQCDVGQNTANIYSKSAVEVQSNNGKLFFLCNVASTV